MAEFDGVLSNSKGGTDAIRAMGARNVHVLYYAADPQIYQRLIVPEDIDISFYGTTAEYREDWLQAMITVPGQRMTDVRFVVRGRLLGDLGRAEVKPFFPFSSLREFISRSKINLVITRRPHASTYGSSTMRPFELAHDGRMHGLVVPATESKSGLSRDASSSWFIRRKRPWIAIVSC